MNVSKNHMICKSNLHMQFWLVDPKSGTAFMRFVCWKPTNWSAFVRWISKGHVLNPKPLDVLKSNSQKCRSLIPTFGTLSGVFLTLKKIGSFYIYIYSFFSKVFKINDEIPWNMSKSNCIPTTAALTVRETLYDANVTSPSTKSAFTSEETTLHWPMLQESESIIQINRNLPVSRCPMEFCKSEWNFHRWIWHAITRNFLDFLDSTLMLRNFDPPTLDDNITAAASHA